MAADLRRVVTAQLGGKIVRQPRGERLLIGQIAGQHIVLEGELDVRHQRRQLRRRQAHADFLTAADLLIGRQRLQFTIEPALFERIDLASVNIEQARGVGAAGAHQVVLVAVVSQHQPGHLIGHRGQQFGAPIGLQARRTHQGVDQDLDVDLVIRTVHTRGVIQGIGVDPSAAQVELDTAERGDTEIAALADDLRADLVGIDAHGVVGAVTHTGLRLGLSFDVGADTAVEQQVDRGAKDRADEGGRGHLADLFVDTQRSAHLDGDRDRLLLP